MFYHPFPQPSPMTKNIQFLFFLSIFFSSLQRIFCIRFSSVQPSPAPPSFPLSKQDNRSVMICFSLRSLHNSPFFPQCVIHILFLLSPTFFFFFFQKACGSLSFNYGVSKDSSAAFMLMNFILPLIAPYSPDFLIPQNLLSWNLILLYSRIVRNLHLIIPNMSHLWTWKPFCLPNCCL